MEQRFPVVLTGTVNPVNPFIFLGEERDKRGDWGNDLGKIACLEKALCYNS